MAAPDIGANFSNYAGNSALGGGSLGFGKIDTRPLDDLARYTFIYNQAEHAQRQKDAEAAAKEIADATSYDLTSSIPKDAELLQTKYNDLINYIRDNPDAINYRNKDQWAKYKTMRNDLENDLSGAKVRNLMNIKRQNEIQEQTNPELKSFLEGQLKDEIAGSNIRTPLRQTSLFDIAPVKVGPAPTLKVQTTDVGKNVIGQADWTMPDMKMLGSVANTLVSGLVNLNDYKNDPRFQSLPDEVKARVEPYLKQQFLAQQASGKLEPVESAKNFNAALRSLPPEFYTADKKLNLDKLKESNNTLVRGIVEQAQAYNQRMDEMTKNIKAGFFKDNFGGELHFGNDASGLNEADFKKINLDDGVSPEELVKMRMLGMSPQPERTIKLLQTDNEIQRQNIAARWAEIGIDKAKLNMANQQSIIGADSVLREVSDAINNATPMLRMISSGDKTKESQRIYKIADPNLLKEFATIDKDGNVVNRPDDIFYDKGNNDLRLTYYKKYTPADGKKITSYDADAGGQTSKTVITDKNGNEVNVGDLILNSKGNPIIEREVKLNPTEWMGQITGRKFSANDKGPVNNFIDQIYNKFDRNLEKMARYYQGGATAPGPETKQKVSASTTQLEKLNW